MNKVTTFLVIVIIALSFCLGSTMQSRAQDRSFSGVYPFITSNDRVGFFDQSNGKIYVYDSNVTNCLFVGQIRNLGDSINTVSSNPSNTSN
jgi:hypothetical protein